MYISHEHIIFKMRIFSYVFIFKYKFLFLYVLTRIIFKFGIRISCRTRQNLKSFSSLSAMYLAIAMELVAAGEGALRQCITLLPILPFPPSKTKSSTKLPFLSNACALTPDGPL